MAAFCQKLYLLVKRRFNSFAMEDILIWKYVFQIKNKAQMSMLANLYFFAFCSAITITALQLQHYNYSITTQYFSQ